MTELLSSQDQIRRVANFQDLVSTPFREHVNAMCWTRELVGDFNEIVEKLNSTGNISSVEPKELEKLVLSERGQLARAIILNDLNLLKAHGAKPVLNVISSYERDEASFFPTDVYSFHVDRSPIPTDTFLCTYHGAASELLPNAQAIKKVLVPDIREQLKKLFDGREEEFESFLTEHFFDLHYQPKPNATIINLGQGHLWRLAVDHPQQNVAPCVHRAPIEKHGENRLLLIC